VLADDWVVVGPTGAVETKRQQEKKIKDNTLVFEAIDPKEVKVRVHGDAAIVMGLYHIKATVDGRTVDGVFRNTEVFTKQAGRGGAPSIKSPRWRGRRPRSADDGGCRAMSNGQKVGETKGETTMRSQAKEMTMSEKETTRVIGVHHVGLSARDPAALAGFYHDVLGLQVVGGSTADTSAFGASAFLRSPSSEEHHDLVLVANPAFQHTAFNVRSLADLRAVYQRVLGRACRSRWPSITVCLLPFTSRTRRAPDRGLLAYGNRLAPALRRSHRLDALRGSNPAEGEGTGRRGSV
jgi:hypothetical protein